MLETLRNAFKIKDIRNRIIFTFLMLVVIRIGSQLPIPGVNNETVFKLVCKSDRRWNGIF